MELKMKDEIKNNIDAIDIMLRALKAMSESILMKRYKSRIRASMDSLDELFDEMDEDYSYIKNL